MQSSELRADQQQVVERFLGWLAEVREQPGKGRWAHIVLPPRTGKTVIAAHIARRSGLHAAFVVPTRVLVHQTRRELRRHAPAIEVGAHFGEVKRTVPHGLNLTTYASLQRHRLTWSPHLASARLVFVDEAHHALTRERRRALEEAFPTDALRVALTATPDYDPVRRVEHVFPEPLARVELKDALVRGLLAPARVEVAEVDVDASEVEVEAGEYRPDQLARVLRQAPFLHAALTFRYRADLRDVPCLVACVTRRQAAELVGYFARHRPKGRPLPALLLGETPAAERERILRAFERGPIDTIVQVGVLVEGWTSARCKLLVDLAPGRSRVRATQKYFRALTRDGDREARLVVLLPKGLRRPPVLPMDLLLEPGEVYECGRRIGASRRERLPDEIRTPIRSVRLVQRVVVSAPLGAPGLDPADLDGVRDVLLGGADFDPSSLPGRGTFESLWFAHPLFSGTGAMLLRWVGVPRAPGAYEAWLARLFPEAVADRLLGECCAEEPECVPWDEDAAACAWPWGELPERDDPEEHAHVLHAMDRVRPGVAQLNPRHRALLEAWSGLDGGGGCTFRELGLLGSISPERARQIVSWRVRTLREVFRLDEPNGGGDGRSDP